MEELYCFKTELYYKPEYSHHRQSYKLEANYQSLKAVANEIWRFISGNEISPFNCDDFRIKVYKHESQKDFLLSIEPHPQKPKALIFNVSTELRKKWNSIVWNRYEPVFMILQKHEGLGDVFIEKDNIADSDFKIAINENTLSKSPYLMHLGIDNYADLFPDIQPYGLEIWYYSLLISVSAETEFLDENHLIKVLKQSINLSAQINKEKGSFGILQDINKLSQHIETAYLKSSFDKIESDVLSCNNEFYFNSLNFGELHVHYELETVSITLPYFTIENHSYELKTLKIENIDSIKELFLYLFKIGYFTNNEVSARFNTFILTLHTRLTDEIWPKDKVVRKDILNTYYDTVSNQQRERWIKGILDDDIQHILHKALKEVNVKKENFNCITSNSSEVYYDGNNLLIKYEHYSEKWDILDISTIKTSLDLYDLVYIELLSKYGINLSRFLLIQLIERISKGNKQFSYDLLTEYDAIVGAREKTERHMAIISKWKNNDDNIADDSLVSEFYSNDYLRKSYNEYYGHPDAEGWVDTSDF